MKRKLMVGLMALTGCATTGPAPRASEAVSALPVESAARALCERFARPERAGELISPAFFASVPRERFEAVLRQVRAQLGDCVAVEREGGEPLRGEFRLRHASGSVSPVRLAVEPAPPHLVSTLWIGPPRTPHADLDSIAAELEKLPGSVSFLVADLRDDGLQVRAALEADRLLAIGSAFKLWVLAELARAVEAGERRWDEVVRLEPAALSLPSGLLQDWPEGTPLTVQSLATLMISRSDNTATDQLIRLLGREQIEQTVRAIGHSAPERNEPFLTTRELFHLKGKAGDAYLAMATAAERRRYLDEVVTALACSEIPPLTRPTRIERLEWFASARDLARVLDWLRRQGEKDPVVRQILAVNPGFPSAKAGRRWVGYKGGSEPGVLNLSLVLQSETGAYQVVIATWNDPAASLEEGRLLPLFERAIGLLAEAED